MNKTKKTKITNKEKLQNMILSIVIAIAIWLVAVYVDDPSITVTANNVSVRLYNENVLSDKKLVIKNKDKFPQFSVRVSGRRSSLMNYMSRITADFDLSEIDHAGEYEIEGIVTIPNSNITLAKKQAVVLKVDVAPISEKTVKLYAFQTGTNKDYVIKSTPVLEEVYIEGASDEVAKVSMAAVEVDITDATDDFESQGEIFFCDSDGNRLTDVSSVKADKIIVGVENQTYQRVVLPVKAELSDELSQEYILDETSVISPAEVVVGILPGTQIDFVNVRIDKNSDTAENYRAFSTVEGTYVPCYASEVSVTPKMHKLTNKIMEIETKTINLPEGMMASYEMKSTLNVRCAEEISPQDIKAIIDLKDAQLGDNMIKLSVESPLVKSYEEKYINVKLSVK